VTSVRVSYDDKRTRATITGVRVPRRIRLGSETNPPLHPYTAVGYVVENVPDTTREITARCYTVFIGWHGAEGTLYVYLYTRRAFCFF